MLLLIFFKFVSLAYRPSISVTTPEDVGIWAYTKPHTKQNIRGADWMINFAWIIIALFMDPFKNTTFF